jgi:hypothetical protein
MFTLQSKLEQQVMDYIHTKNELSQLEFTIGGNWDYSHGSFDRSLDKKRTVWLRIPFHMTQGEMDAEVDDTEARIQIDQPFVLKHLYEEGLDGEAQIRTYGALVDQFQEPKNKDAQIESHWIDEARTILQQVERILQ